MNIWKIYIDDGDMTPHRITEADFIKHTEEMGYWKTGEALKVLTELGIMRTPWAIYFPCLPIPFKRKWVDGDSLQVDGVDTRDYPDFVDSYLSEALWVGGEPLSDTDLAELDEIMPDLAYELALEKYQ